MATTATTMLRILLAMTTTATSAPVPSGAHTDFKRHLSSGARSGLILHSDHLTDAQLMRISSMHPRRAAGVLTRGKLVNGESPTRD